MRCQWFWSNFGQSVYWSSGLCSCVAGEFAWCVLPWNLLALVYHIFFICSSADGQLDCSHILAIVNSAAVITGVNVLFALVFSFSPVTHPGLELPDHMVVLVLVF